MVSVVTMEEYVHGQALVGKNGALVSQVIQGHSVSTLMSSLHPHLLLLASWIVSMEAFAQQSGHWEITAYAHLDSLETYVNQGHFHPSHPLYLPFHQNASIMG